MFAAMAVGGTRARTCSIASGAVRPGLGLAFVAGSTATGSSGTVTQWGTLTGTPTTAGTYNFAMRVTDGTSPADLPVTIFVS